MCNLSYNNYDMKGLPQPEIIQHQYVGEVYKSKRTFLWVEHLSLQRMA